jgi:hypothetical protein
MKLGPLNPGSTALAGPVLEVRDSVLARNGQFWYFCLIKKMR